MPITLTARVDATPLLREVTRYQKTTLPRLRQQTIEQLSRDVLANIIRLNPVDTARSRAAWAAALLQLGGFPPADWMGPHPQADAVAQGAALSSHSTEQTDETSTVTFGNAVSYVSFLEFGTRQMAPFAMVAQTLSQSRARIRELFAQALQQTNGA